ncbi:MAG: hypothetical protein NW201_03055 [Gemmatimonadales bacterium]|nr:hypothetical protein [Gemmatimonadales bacterium]
MFPDVRRVILLGLVAILLGCGGSSPSGPSTPTVDPVVGAYDLFRVNGFTLPTTLFFTNGDRQTILSGVGSAQAGGGFSGTYQTLVNNVQAVVAVSGTWQRTVGGYSLSVSYTVNGQPAGSGTSTASLNGSTLIINDPSTGIVEEWRRR